MTKMPGMNLNSGDEFSAEDVPFITSSGILHTRNETNMFGNLETSGVWPHRVLLLITFALKIFTRRDTLWNNSSLFRVPKGNPSLFTYLDCVSQSGDDSESFVSSVFREADLCKPRPSTFWWIFIQTTINVSVGVDCFPQSANQKSHAHAEEMKMPFSVQYHFRVVKF